ncbi:MAG: ATP-binding protein [Dehalococcoidales bacterium]|jgi:two-component system OmpR family sensor kinase
MRSLSWKLAGALLLIVAISVGLMAYLINLNTTREFNQYVAQGNQKNIQSTSAALSQLYSKEGNWDGIQSLLPDFLRSPNDRLVVADATGIIVGDSINQWVGKTAGSVGLSNGTTITASGQDVGELYLITSQVGNGKGFMGGGKGGTSSTPTSVATLEQDFIDRFNNSLLTTGLIVAAIALIVGLILTRQITRPIKALVNGVRQIARGNLKHRVDIRSKDELGNLGESFNAMAVNLDKAEQERKRIVADIAHDLRTPLTVIEGTVTGIQDGVFQPDKEHLDTIKEQTSLLTRLTSDLRDLSLAESGQLKLVLAPTDLADLAQRKANQFAVKAQEKGIKINTNLPGNLSNVNIDPARIEQVLGNLITNAIRHTSSGSIKISIQQVNSDAAHQVNKPSLILSVADTGEGIAEEHLPHIFERFYRVEKSRAKSEGGSGLGLAIVKQMVQAHGGNVWVESKIGKGSTFNISLPT